MCALENFLLKQMATMNEIKKISGSEGLKNSCPVTPRTLILEMLTPSNWLDNTEVGNIPFSLKFSHKWKGTMFLKLSVQN